MRLNYSKHSLLLVLSLLSLSNAYATDSTDSIFDPLSSKQSRSSDDSFDFDGSEFGINNSPLALNGNYDRYDGLLLNAGYTTYIDDLNSLDFNVKSDADEYRLNGEWGLALAENHSVSVSLERSWENNDYDLNDGSSTSEWGQANTIGAGYQYDLPSTWLQNIDINGYYTNKDAQDVGSDIEDQSDAAATESRGIATGLTLQPWETGLIKTHVNYDVVSYDVEQDSDDPSSQGLGGSIEYEQLLSTRVKANMLASMREEDNEFGAGFSWLVPTSNDSRLELMFDSSYVKANDLSDDGYQLGFQLRYAWGGDSHSKQRYDL